VNDLSTPFPTTTYTRRQARQIAAIAKGEIKRRKLRPDLYGRQGIMHLWDIHAAALGVQDRLEGAADELDALLSEWAETDPRTFVLLADLGRKFPFGEAA
jgi:hypothetical protein